MSFNLIPDFCLNKYSDLTAEYLTKQGIKGLILDIDNTLEPYENSEPSEGVLLWLESMKNSGIKCAFVSNNGKDRVEKFNSKLGLYYICKAKKPFKKNVLKALSHLNVPTSSAAIMGDQIFTDVWAGKNAGIKTFLVPPIKDKRDLFTRLKRLFEKGIINKYERERNKL